MIQGACVKERSIILACIIGSLAGTASLYLVSFMLEETEMGAGEIGTEHVGMRVALNGSIGNVDFHNNGHIFFTLMDDTGSVDVVIWESRAEQLELSGVNLSGISEGMQAGVRGDVEYYRGNVQVVL